MSGKQKILEHLKSGKTVTKGLASVRGWSKSLSKRISELEAKGFKIDRTISHKGLAYKLNPKTPKKLL